MDKAALLQHMTKLIVILLFSCKAKRFQEPLHIMPFLSSGQSGKMELQNIGQNIPVFFVMPDQQKERRHLLPYFPVGAELDQYHPPVSLIGKKAVLPE